MTPEECIEYLDQQVIPDCNDSGMIETARDFSLCARIIKNLNIELAAQIRRNHELCKELGLVPA